MKLSRTFRFAVLAAFSLIIIALVIILVFIPSRNDLASNPTLTPTAIIAPTNTRFPTRTTVPTAAPTGTPTGTPTSAPTIALTNTATSAPTATPTVTLVPTFPPVLPTSSMSTSTPVVLLGFHLQYLTPVMTMGSTGQVTISTAPRAACTLTVYDARGKVSLAPGLGSKTAGVDGMCVWIWTVSRSDNPGTAFVKIDANGMTQSFVYTLQ